MTFKELLLGIFAIKRENARTDPQFVLRAFIVVSFILYNTQRSRCSGVIVTCGLEPSLNGAPDKEAELC